MSRSSTSTGAFRRGTVNQWLLSALSILLTIGLCTLWIMNRPGPPKYSELRISTPRISPKSGNQPKLTLEVGEQVVAGEGVVETAKGIKVVRDQAAVGHLA